MASNRFNREKNKVKIPPSSAQFFKSSRKSPFSSGFRLLFLSAGGFFLISIFLALNPVEKDEVLEISTLKSEIQDAALLENAVGYLATIYPKGFPHQKIDSLVKTMMTNDISAYKVTKSLLKQLEQSNLSNRVDLQAELLLWLSQSGLSYIDGRGNNGAPKGHFVDLADIDELGKLAMNWIYHDDPFIRGMAEWAISARINMLNNNALTIWPAKEKDAPDWYHTWRGLLATDFVLESDYVRQGIRLKLHRSIPELSEDGGKIIHRAEQLHDKIKKAGSSQSLQLAEQKLEKLQELQARLASMQNLHEARKVWIGMRKVARDIVLNVPEIDFDEMIFSYRHAYHSGGNITNGGKSYHIKPGGDIYLLKGFDPTNHLKPLIGDNLEAGHMQGMDLWYEANKLVFSYAEQPRYFDEVMYESDQGFDDWPNGLSGPALLYEIDLRNNTLKQLTDHPYNSDVEPSYLPNGEIVFSSTRSNFSSQCSGNFFQNKKITNLYKMSGDGSDIRSLSNNKDFDRFARVLDDGQIVYTRWEYQERHLWQTHNLWTARPDGAYQEALFKQHNNNGPMSLRDARQIPGSDKLVAIGAGHHEWSQGAVFIIDYHKGTNEEDGFRIVTPHIAPREGGLGNKKHIEQGGVIDNGGLYQHPFPLSEETFLVGFSYHEHQKTMNAKNFALYLIDVYGNKELIHRDPVLSASFPVAVKNRPIPPVIVESINEDVGYATVYVNDIYDGVPEFKEGEVKYIRIGHHTEWPFQQTGERVVDYNHLHYTPSGSWSRSVGMWSWSPARVIGTVPVEEDGSAHFKVPANIPIYFQALDENHLELRRMRSFITFQPGETRGCTGCHESRDESPAALTQVPSALHRAPDTPVPPSWGETTLPDYEMHIQPIFTSNCVSCHGPENPAAGLEFSARVVDDYYQSYRTLFGLSPDELTPVWEPQARKLMHPNHNNIQQDKESLRKMETNQYPGQLISIANRFGDNAVSKVKEFGSSQSKLIHAMMDEYHQEHAKLDEQEWIDLVTWIDLNAPYWGTFVDKEPAKYGDMPERVFVQFPMMFDKEYKTEIIRKGEKQ